MLKRNLISIALLTFCALLLAACGGTEKATNGNSNTAGTENTNKAASAGSPATASSPASTSSTSTGDKVGIPECDDYLAKYEACVSGKIPEAQRSKYKSSMEDLRKSWREMAADPKAKAGLVMVCQLAAEQSKQQFKTYDCDF